jgi:hypothetical protein
MTITGTSDLSPVEIDPTRMCELLVDCLKWMWSASGAACPRFPPCKMYRDKGVLSQATGSC